MGQSQRQRHQRGNFFTLTAALLLPSLVGCKPIAKLQQQTAKQKQEAALRSLVKASADEATNRLGANALGEIHYVDEESGFVLVRVLTGRRLPVGLKMIGRGADGKIVKLSASSASKPPFLAADILSGKAEKGMAVFEDPSAKSPEPTPTIREQDLPPLHTPNPLPTTRPPQDAPPGDGSPETPPPPVTTEPTDPNAPSNLVPLENP